MITGLFRQDICETQRIALFRKRKKRDTQEFSLREAYRLGQISHKSVEIKVHCFAFGRGDLALQNSLFP